MPTKSRWNLSVPSVSLPTFVFTSPTHSLPETPLFLDAERPSTYNLSLSTFRLWSQRLAAGLQAAGLQQGDRVMLYSGNTLFFPMVVMGIIMGGGVFTGANPTYTARELGYQLQNSGARFLIVADASLEVGLEGAAQAGLDKSCVFVFDDGYDAFDGKCSGRLGCAPWTDLLANEATGRTFSWHEGEDVVDRVAALNYSSGTTGLPKGVMITHGNYVANSLQQMYIVRIGAKYSTRKPNMRWLCFLPMYHAMAQAIFCVSAAQMQTPVYIMRKFDFPKMLQCVQDFHITDLHLVPPLVVMMAKHPATRTFDLSSVVAVVSGAAPLGREITVEFEKLWPNGQVNLKQGYGMTELTCSLLGWDSNERCEDFSVGEPNPNTEVMLVDAQGREVDGIGPEARGEVWVKGPNVMKGYWRNEKATRETITEDGWLKTGDVAYKDTRGKFFIVDRMKELIKVKGLQVAPAELEALLLEHAAIADAAVVGVTMNDEECPLAYVVLRAKDAATPDEIAGFVEGRVAKHKRLTGGVKIVEEIRKNPSGKILRRLYREEAQKEVNAGKPLAKL